MIADNEETSPLPPELVRSREAIEAIDREVVALLQKRVALALRTGELKREHGLPILDPSREAQVVRNAVANARAAGLPEEPVRQIFWQILGLSRKAQQGEQ